MAIQADRLVYGVGLVVGWSVSGAAPNGLHAFASMRRAPGAPRSGPRVRGDQDSQPGHGPAPKRQQPRHRDPAPNAPAARAVATSLGELLGIEGEAAANYFEMFGTMLHASAIGEARNPSPVGLAALPAIQSTPA